MKNLFSGEFGKTRLCFLGQAGFLIQSSRGGILAIDPYLSDCVEKIENDHIGYKRLLPKIVDPNNLNIDILICTHFHRDHFDIDSVPIIMSNAKTILFCPDDCLDDVKKFNQERVKIISPGDQYCVNEFTLHFVNCDHGVGAPRAVGVVVEVDGKRILEVGDTCLRVDWKHEYLHFGMINVLIAPINGAYGNLNESECAKLSKILEPELTIPCHYGMFANHGGNPGLFIKKMRSECPENRFLILRHGEIIEL